MGKTGGKKKWEESHRMRERGGFQGSCLTLPARAAFPLCPSQVSGNQAKFLGRVGGAWARQNTPQVGRYPVLGDTHVIKAGDLSTPKVSVSRVGIGGISSLPT